MENLWYNPILSGGNVMLEHRRRIAHQIALRITLRDASNPFEISVTEFRRVYRLPQPCVLELVRILRPYFPPRTSPMAVQLELKVFTALAFYACGSYQRMIGRISDLNLSQSSVSNIVNEVSNVLNHPAILTRFIHLPTTEEERNRVMRINERLGLPRVLGFVDRTQIKIVPPPRQMNREAYFCRKGFTSINAQIICDANLYIMNVVARYPGSCNDPYIWSQCAARNLVIAAYHASRCWLLGDSGYALEPWLMVPLPHAERGTPEFLYTSVHCHCRNAVERCIGVLKARWRCLLWDRTLHYFPDKCGLIINACCVLHNFCIMSNVQEPRPVRENDVGEDDDEEEEHDIIVEAALAEQERRFLINYVHWRHAEEID